MKKLQTIIILLISLNAKAQDSTYVPFDFEHSEWYMAESTEHHDIGGPYFYYYDYKLKADGDSILNGKSYKSIYRFQVNAAYPNYASKGANTLGFLREENKKIYNYLNKYSVEYVLYDFTMQVGDSIDLPQLPQNMTPGLRLKAVIKDSINTEYGYRNIIKLKTLASYQPYDTAHTNPYYGADTIVWIEGIGSNRGLLYDATIADESGFETWTNSSFLCFKLDTALVYGGPCYYYTLINVAEDKLEKVSIFPNPTANTININLPSAITKGTIQLYNAVGKLAGAYPVSPQLDVSALPNGIYCLRLQSGAAYYSEKVIISR